MRIMRRALLGSLALPAIATAQPLLSEGAPRVATGFRLSTLAEGFANPWSLAFLPDGTALVTERPGRLRRLRDGQLDPRPIEGLPPIHVGGQAGLFEVTPHPGFARNGLVYLTYAHGTAQANRTRLARAVLDGHALRELQPIFETDPAKPGNAHFGGRLLFLPDGTLLVSIGDGGNPPNSLDGRLIRENAQDLGNHLGKVIRLNPDGSVPPDNPFVNAPGRKPEIFSWGHRNIQGLAWDPFRNAIWSTEHGSSGGDELNRLEPGRNYGWPAVSHSVEYRGGAQIGSGRAAPGMADPVLVWMTTAAPSGLALYTGARFPDWRGDLFAGALRGNDVRRIRLDAAGRALGEESIPVGARVREVRQGPDGYLYLLTDQPAGARLMRIEPA
jgi:glucose/arabinose dehydrogenase